MLFYGINITAPGDPLHPVAVADFYAALRHPKPALRQQIDQLRIMQTVDKAGYRLQKKKLPYLVCGHFKPAVRRRENFVRIALFMVDLDGVGAHFDKTVLWQRLTADPRLMLLFTSPGGDGLKLLFRLAEGCTDYGLFSVFYKLFVAALCRQYSLEAIVDASTSDVTRACFVSYDEEAYYNEAPLPVVMSDYVNAAEPDTLWDARAGAEAALKEVAAVQAAAAPTTEQKAAGPAPDVLAAIRQKLNPAARRPAKAYYVPPEADDFLQKVQDRLPAFNLQLLESTPIQYGRKLKLATAGAWAEINLFYGKRGYTFVKTTKTGSHPGLADLCVQVLEQVLQENAPGL